MKKIILSAALFAVSLTMSAQVGIGTVTPEGALDVVSATSGLVLPRVASTAAVVNPNGGPVVNGTMVYDMAAKCVKAYENDAWSDCITKPVTPSEAALAEVLEDSSSTGGESNANGTAVTFAQLSAITGITGLDPANQTDYETAIAAETGFSNPPTLAQVQAIIDAVNLANDPTPPLTVDINIGTGTPITFLAHNLGADTSLDANTPVQAIHGNYYQWGRSAIVADASTPAGAIAGWNTTSAANGAWQDASKTGTDPCPTGYRVPTMDIWNAVITNNNPPSRTGSFADDGNFTSAIHFGAGATQLTLPASGYRGYSNGALLYRGTFGSYWSSTEAGPYANNLYFTSSNATTIYSYRTAGYSVRCVSE